MRLATFRRSHVTGLSPSALSSSRIDAGCEVSDRRGGFWCGVPALGEGVDEVTSVLSTLPIRRAKPMAFSTFRI